jgi:hypothetical protein
MLCQLYIRHILPRSLTREQIGIIAKLPYGIPEMARWVVALT